MPDQGIISKSFFSVFILEKSKLSKLLTVINNKYQSIGLEPLSRYEIILENEKQILLNDIEHVFSLDNTIKNPVEIFKIIFEGSQGDMYLNCYITYKRKKNNIVVNIESSNIKWCNELFADIEEQIERTFDKNLIYSIKSLSGFIMGLLYLVIFLSISFLFLSSYEPIAGQKEFFLTESNINEIMKDSKSADSIEDKIDIIYKIKTYQLANLTTKKSYYKIIIQQFNIGLFFILFPLIFIMSCSFYLMKYCYPGSIFIWGDFEDYYNKIIHRRKFTSNTIIIALIIGIIANLFVFGLSKFIKSQ